MSDFCLSCCSTVDLSPEWVKKRDLRYVRFRYTLDGTEYLDDRGVSMPSEELFRRMSNGVETKTAQGRVEIFPIKGRALIIVRDNTRCAAVVDRVCVSPPSQHIKKLSSFSIRRRSSAKETHQPDRPPTSRGRGRA